MAIGNNKVVTLNYTLKDFDGNIIQSTKEGNPFVFLTGKNQVLPKLESEVDTMLIGGKKTVKIEAAEAYGEYDENAVQNLKRAEFPKDMQLEPGMEFVMNSPEGGQVPFVVKEVDTEVIKVDFNHPLAGIDLDFDIELLDVRNATADELNHGHVHGAGGHHH